ncbi:hypothetical protein [Burkholderia anthina]|uniref:hypothetical protein n=1 Tax=Burkholderia anthina TaxID=179879 RepID=UPI0037C13424
MKKMQYPFFSIEFVRIAARDGSHQDAFAGTTADLHGDKRGWASGSISEQEIKILGVPAARHVQ